MAFFSKMRDMYKIQKQAKAAKKELKNIHIESEDEFCKVTVSAEQELISFNLTDEAVSQLKADGITKEKLGEALKKTLNKALKKAQEIAAEKTKGLFQEMGISK